MPLSFLGSEITSVKHIVSVLMSTKTGILNHI
uniref:Uncharacterized protein n=1 Tax=Anguilla anguilla TaxID=7936 RepID=A0A0E9WKY4_ANGAN